VEDVVAKAIPLSLEVNFDTWGCCVTGDVVMAVNNSDGDSGLVETEYDPLEPESRKSNSSQLWFTSPVITPKLVSSRCNNIGAEADKDSVQ